MVASVVRIASSIPQENVICARQRFPLTIGRFAQMSLTCQLAPLG